MKLVYLILFIIIFRFLVSAILYIAVCLSDKIDSDEKEELKIKIKCDIGGFAFTLIICIYSFCHSLIKKSK